ncbi:hypothetical protein Taro_015047 [Colocasia esculenta]|uniref:Rho GDP-dissociation inhibitor 1 n=1 Tax=Colocasia esculenta TaxID=4460 RepID=A0A843UAK0_COLES|nr:hypothetical protein [Colocasia esculenta]
MKNPFFAPLRPRLLCGPSPIHANRMGQNGGVGTGHAAPLHPPSRPSSQFLAVCGGHDLPTSPSPAAFDAVTMSLAVGAPSACSKDMAGDDGVKEGESVKGGIVGGDDADKLNRQMSEASLYGTEEEEEEEDGDGKKIDLGPQCTLKQQLEKDKEDESLRRWKEQLLGSVDLESVGEHLEADVKILSFSILSPGRPDIVLPLPMPPSFKGPWFTLKEGSNYRLRFSFTVGNNIVSGLRYHNTVWKTGVKVDSTKEMLGTFSPQLEPYVCEMHEETTPSGLFARGSYSARSKFVDDDGKCYLEINYTFDIRKEWQPVTS